MSLQHIILGMLRKRPKSGYDLKKELESTIRFFWEADISRIYRSLADMEKRGWVEFETVVQETSPNKKVYSITAAGTEALERWLAEPGKTAGPQHNPFLAQLHFGDAIPVQTQVAVMEARRRELRHDLAELERRVARLSLPIPLPADALQQGVTREMFSLEYGARRLQFEIDWVENIIEVLRNAP